MATASKIELPNQHTVYVNNLDSRVKIPLLRETLKTIFETCGPVLDIHAHAYTTKQGQAFVVFKDYDSAAQAIEQIDGFHIFGKPMKCAWAKVSSDTTAKQTLNEDAYKTHRKQRLAERDVRVAAKEKEKQAKIDSGATATARPKALPSTAESDKYHAPHNKLKAALKLKNPSDQLVQALRSMFGSFKGFVSVIPIPGREFVLVEYEDIDCAINAKSDLDGMIVGDGEERCAMAVTYLAKNLNANVS